LSAAALPSSAWPVVASEALFDDEVVLVEP